MERNTTKFWISAFVIRLANSRGIPEVSGKTFFAILDLDTSDLVFGASLHVQHFTIKYEGASPLTCYKFSFRNIPPALKIHPNPSLCLPPKLHIPLSSLSSPRIRNRQHQNICRSRLCQFVHHISYTTLQHHRAHSDPCRIYERGDGGGASTGCHDAGTLEVFACDVILAKDVFLGTLSI